MAIEGPAWDNAFEAAPRDADNASGGAREIRQLKAAIKNRLFRDHETGSDLTENAGHLHVSFVNEYGTGEQPTAASEGDFGYLFVRGGELIWRDGNGNELTLSSALTSVASSVPTGSMLEFGGTVAPSGYLLCDGSQVSRSTYSALYTAIGTRFGPGDGAATFHVPDFRRRVAVGSGGSATSTLGAVVGNAGGAETHTLTTAEMPSHSHTLPAHLNREENAASGSGPGAWTAGTASRTNAAGGGGAHNNMQPSLIVTKIIKT